MPFTLLPNWSALDSYFKNKIADTLVNLASKIKNKIIFPYGHRSCDFVIIDCNDRNSSGEIRINFQNQN